MVRIISALILAVTAACASAEEPIKLADNPPDRHIVVPGDTLWGISAKFLKEPWRWPEVWRLNKDQIKNPHRIYPGDIVLLDLSSGNPRLKIAKPVRVQPQVYSEELAKEIPSIPPHVIAPFISRPLVIEEKDLETAPKIVATQEDRINLSNGDVGYVSGIPDAKTIDWQIFRPGKPLKDPENGEVIGYEALFVGNAKLLHPGEPALVSVTTIKEEAGRGDRLVPAGAPHLQSYVPHEPAQKMSGQVMSIYGGLYSGGKHSVVSLNRGSRDGLEIGHVVALYRKRVSEGFDETGSGKVVATPVPEERYALAFVFRTFNRVAYALVMESSKAVMVGDAVRNP